ncbi:hypothetical protein KQR54_33425, partial [Mycobacterium gordonae]|uniref:hypothetical protein n=1 Tax=Mycobacterium gordonae TaxID=1778 RepID=UPI002108A14B
DSKTPESTPCPPPAPTTRHNKYDHVAYFSTVTPGLRLDRRQHALQILSANNAHHFNIDDVRRNLIGIGG